MRHGATSIALPQSKYKKKTRVIEPLKRCHQLLTIPWDYLKLRPPKIKRPTSSAICYFALRNSAKLSPASQVNEGGRAIIAQIIKDRIGPCCRHSGEFDTRWKIAGKSRAIKF